MTWNPLRHAFLDQGYLFPLDGLTPPEAAAALRDYRAYDAVVGRVGGWMSEFGRFPKVHLLSLWADAIVHDERVLDVVEQVLGPELLVWSTTIFTRPAHSGETLAWHQDALHYGLAGHAGQSLRVWVALTATTAANGTMRYAPGTHRSGILAHEWHAAPGSGARGFGDLEIGVEVDESRAVDVLLEPGQFAMHDLALAHASGANTTDEDRVNFAIDYITPSVRPQGHVDSALPVRGSCAGTAFLRERRPEADFDSAAVESFRAATMLRVRRLAGLTAKPPTGRGTA